MKFILGMPKLVIMNYLIDASSIINLNNALALELVAGLRECELWISPIVFGECQPSCAEMLVSLKQEGKIKFSSEDEVPVDLFLKLLEKFNLGDGETEAIAIADGLGFGLCCDDRQARTLGKTVLGENKIIGSLRLLRWCVEENLTSCETAFHHFDKMKSTGGFLPPTPNTFFCTGLKNC